MSAADIVFVFPPAHGNVGAFRGHLGVAYLRAVLAREGLKTAQYINQNPGTVGEIEEDILRANPKIAGFTVYDANFTLTLALARRLKDARPDIRIVFGGPSATFGAEEILARHTAVDACVMGESEETGPAIFSRLLDGHPDDTIPLGLAVRRRDRIVAPGVPPLVGTSGPLVSVQSMLDVVPSPYLSGILDDGRAGVLTGRGCTHHCQYCCFAALGRKKLRLHSIDRVVAELEWIAAHQKRTGDHYIVAVHDDAFTLLPGRAKSLCQAIAARKLDLVLSCITRADAIDEELLKLMREAGFVSLAFGLESAVPSVLRATGKVRPPDHPNPDLTPEREFVERVRSSVVLAKKLGFNVGVSIILGLPTETEADGAATLAFVKKLPVDFYMHNFLWVFPGTPLWDTRRQYGVSCAVNPMGLATTTDYAYDLNHLAPNANCSLSQDANVVRRLALDSLYGCAGPTTDAGISAIVLEAPELTGPTGEWLAGTLDIGGVLLQIYPPMKRLEEPIRLDADRSMFAECLIPARHHIQLLPRATRSGASRWLIACSGVDLYCTHKRSLVSVEASDEARPFLDWLDGSPSACQLCEISGCLRKPAQLHAFLNKSGEDVLGGQLRRMPVAPGARYSGRWLEGQAPCLGLTRIEVDSEGRIRPCRHAEPIGVIGDDRSALAARLRALAEEAQQRRGCSTCPATHCPRCPFPGLDERTYCSIMRKQVRALGFFRWAHLYSRVPSILAEQRDKLGGD